jgi:hypothetical protein
MLDSPVAKSYSAAIPGTAAAVLNQHEIASICTRITSGSWVAAFTTA